MVLAMCYAIYNLGSHTGTLYIGVTSNLCRVSVFESSEEHG